MRLRSLAFGTLSALILIAAPLGAAPLTCLANAVPTLVRSEGITERMGDIVLSCSGGDPGLAVTGNLSLFLTVPITNKRLANNTADVILTVDTGSGPQIANVPAAYGSSFSLVFNGLSFTVPASGQVTLRITNFRGAPAAVSLSAINAIQATLAFNGTSALLSNTNPLTVAFPSRGLLTSASSATIACTGSPLPSGAISLSSLFEAGTRFQSTRVTEGNAEAFQKKDANTDTGVRFMITYSGFPAGARLFIPDVVAGSDATQATAGGDLGFTQAGGSYTPGSGSLLLSRVRGAAPDGTGGVPAYVPPVGGPVASFDAVGEVLLTSGAGYAVYEVMDANPSVSESAQWPTFLAIPRATEGNTVMASQKVTFAPVSTINAPASGPVPRFLAADPPSDCAIVSDCEAPYMPRLELAYTPQLYKGIVGSGPQSGAIAVQNNRGGLLSWTARLTYKSGTGWIRMDPENGFNNGTVRLLIMPEKLTAAGTYEASITIDAGALAGTQTVPIRLDATAAPATPPAAAVVSSIVNAASLRDGPLVPGSLATLFGEKLSGANVAVTFDAKPATISYKSDTQINLLVPAHVTGADKAQVVVSRDGVASKAFTVNLASCAPAIFNNGILNQDYSGNSDSVPALAGSVIQVFATGLPMQGNVTAKLHDRENLVPLHAGPAPGFDGLYQINLLVPFDLPTMTTEVYLCGTGSDQRKACSSPVKLRLKAAQ